MIDILTNYEKQLVLYTKNWFQKTYLIKDIKIIYGKEYDVTPQCLTDIDILRSVEKVYFKLKDYGLLELESSSLFGSLFKRVNLWKGKNSIEVDDVIEFMCGQISIIPVKDVIELGKPDYTILPQKTKE